MSNRAIIFQTQVAVSQLVITPDAKTCSLVAPSSPWPSTRTADEACVFGHHMHDDESVLALTYGRSGHRVTWMLDPWTQSTSTALEAAKHIGGFVVFYADWDSLALVDLAPATPATLDDILGGIADLRKRRRRRDIASFPTRALHPDVLADHAVHPHHPERHFPDLPGSASVTVLLGPEHVRDLAKRR